MLSCCWRPEGGESELCDLLTHRLRPRRGRGWKTVQAEGIASTEHTLGAARRGRAGGECLRGK